MISIVTPCYNAEKYLERLYASIKNLLKKQDFNWIIIDDNSQDNTKELVDSFCDQKIIYHKLNKNMGPSFARLEGSRISNAKFVFFLDADDLIYETAFLNFIDEVLLKPTFDFYYGLAEPVKVNSDKTPFVLNNQSLNSNFVIIKRPTDFIKYKFPTYSSLLVNREFFIEKIYSINLNWGEDLYSYLLLSKYGIGCGWFKNISVYFIHGNGRGSALSLKNRVALFNSLFKVSFVGPKKLSSLLYFSYISFRTTLSYLYKFVIGFSNIKR